MSGVAEAQPRHRQLGLTDAEYDLIVEKLGREPNGVELAMFSLMWSEHCGYKHSRRLLKTLPTEGPAVVMGPGENADTPFTSTCARGDRLSIPMKHMSGRYYAPPETVASMERHGQVVLRYAPGGPHNGSLHDIAGVTNEAGNVMGLMPHPEHAVDPLLGSTDGSLILGSLVDAARARLFATA